MAYDKHVWEVREPITQTKMNNIETGIKTADSTASEAKSNAKLANDKIGSLENLDNEISNRQDIVRAINAVYSVADRASGEASTASTGAELGTKAWNQVVQAIEYDANTGEVTRSLQNRLLDDEDAIGDASDYADSVFQLVDAARKVGTVLVDGRQVQAESLAQKVSDIDRKIGLASQEANGASTLITENNIVERLNRLDSNANISESPYGMSVPDIINEIKGARGKNKTGGNNTSIDARLDFIDGGGNAPSRTLPDIITEVDDAHRDGVTNDTLDKRFDAIDNVGSASNQTHLYRITQLETEMSNARSGAANLDARLDGIDSTVSQKVAKTDIKKTLTYSTDDDTVLQALQGKLLKDDIDAINDKIGTGYDSTNTVKKAIADAITTAANDATSKANAAQSAAETTAAADATSKANAAESNAKTYTDNKLGDGITTSSTVTAQLAAINDKFGSTITSSNKVTDAIATAKSEAISAAATDATGKANTAEQNAKNYADTQLAGKASTQSVTDLDTRLDKIDGGSALDITNGTLSARVTALEGRDTIVINKPNSGSNYTSKLPNSTAVETPSADADYLIADDEGKYFYWRYINNSWEKISGAGGSGNGTSSGLIVEQLPNASDADENTDYFIYDEESGAYLHYRFTTIDNVKQSKLIGADLNNIKKYTLSTSSVDDKNYIDFYQFGYGVDTAELDQGTRIAHIELVGGGGGTFNTKQLTRITPRNLKLPIKSDERIYLRFFYTNGTANESDYYKLTQENATMQATVIMGGGENTLTSGDPTDKSTTWPTKTISVIEDGQTVQRTIPAEPGDPECPVGFYVFDVTDYCKNLGKQTFILTVTDIEDSTVYTTMQWNITLIDLSINSNFTENSINALGESVNFTYIPTGDIEKTAYFFIDDVQIDTQVLSARTVDEQTFVIPGYTQEGVHKLRVYLRASDNGNQIYSESIYRDLIWKDSSSSTLILSSPYRGRTIDIQQYNTIEIPYTIAGNSNTYTIQYYVNNFTTSYNEVTLSNTNAGKWIYRPLAQGTQNLRITVNGVSINFTLNVTANEVDIAPYSNNLILEFDPTGLSNNSASAKAWTNGTYHLTVSDNFDWYNGGYGSDTTGDYFLIKSGTRAYFDYKMFTSEPEIIETQGSDPVTIPSSKVYKTGQEMKIIFKTSAVRSIDTIWFTNMGRYDKEINKEVGIELRAHEGYLKTDTASNEAVGTGDEQVAATNTYLYFPYSEEDRIELDININKENGSNGAFTMSYEDGVPSKAYAYTHTQKLYHDANNPNGESIITIGSDDCDVYIYKLRIYNNELTQAQVLRNFIADGKTIDECVDRYQRNCIYYDAEHNEYSPYATSGFVLDPEALATKIPSVKVLMLDAPYFTENKKSFIKDSTLRCIHAEGPEGIPFRSRGAADNWYFENGYHAGQGTTSDKYGDSGRNIDFLFNCDGSHKPSDKVNAIAGYKSQVTTGYGTEDAVTSVVQDWKGPENEGKISLTSTSIPNNFFNFKVNIASSENVNNALLQKRYNDFLPYISPAKARDARIKNDMEFVPAVLFVRERNQEISTHKEFNDTNWHFYALGNLGDSKKTDYTRAYDPTDMNEFTIEISDNNTNNSQFQTGVYMVNGVPTLETFEAVQDIDDKGALIPDSYTAQGRSGAIATTDYVYPLDTPALKALWNATDPQTGELLNKNHWSLVNEPYDGDHSFEMRYACCGDYRDGKMVNDTTGQGTAQRAINSKVWQAFYSWVVTASNEEFVRDLDQWCVRSAVEFWYAFTHYYTMMDSRAKNTFWHFAKTGKYRKITNPIEDMYHVYMVSNDAQLVPGTTNEWTGTFTKPSGTFNASNTYYTEYAFDLWDYDNDTALGIDNNGELIFPYGKEDRDYKTADDPASGYVFNGAGSVFWRRLSDLCTSEISSIFNTVNEQFFSAENLIEQFDVFQSCYPEAIWQLDIQRKYIRPFTGDTSDGSKTRQSKRFLESMMQGRKKYQRRQWIKDQYYYFGSKYKLNNVTEDFFYLDCYTGPDDALITELKQQGRDEEAAQYVGSNWDLTITPYQDMYINASFGETAKSPVRARAGEPVEMICPFTSMNNTRIYIYGASRLKALAGKAIKNTSDEIIGAEGLASLYVGVHSIEKTDKLQHLYMGTDKPTYRNSNFTKLTLNENSPILETLDIRNCGSLAGELKLGGCNNLRIVEAEGTNISLITLPASSQIATLHLPATVTNLSLFAAYNLQNFYIKNKVTGLIDYSNLRSMIIDSSDNFNTINWINIAKACINNLNYLHLLNLNTSSIIDMSELSPFVNRKQAIETDTNLINLTGNLNVTGEWSTVERDYYGGLPSSVWPGLQFDTSAGTEVTRYKIVYKYDALTHGGEEIYSTYITPTVGNDYITIPEIYSNQPGVTSILSSAPDKPSTKEYYYTFGTIGNNGYYSKYTGWRLVSTGNMLTTPTANISINSIDATNTIIVETIFNSSAMSYPIYWYLNEDDATPAYIAKDLLNNNVMVEYGKNYNGHIPTVQDLVGKTLYTINTSGSNVTYKIFNGWASAPINLTLTDEEAAQENPAYKIYAQWRTGTNVPLATIRDSVEYTPEKLLLFSKYSSLRTNEAYFSTNKRFDITMGYDGLSGGTQLTPFTSGGSQYIDIFSGDDPYPRTTTISPLSSSNNAFTLVLDYQFDIDYVYDSTVEEAVLVGCYENRNDAIYGFRLYYDPGEKCVKIGFGNTRLDEINHTKTLTDGKASRYRNIITLRHAQDDPVLYVYSGIRVNDSHGLNNSSNMEILESLDADGFVQTLEWSNISTEAKLIFGALSTNSLGNQITGARGKIYWAKYWDHDLGAGECRMLAAWPHETITFGVEDYAENLQDNKRIIPTTTGITQPNIILTALSTSQYIGPVYKTLQNNTYANGELISWNNSWYRTFSNNRIFYALPITLQSILSKTYNYSKQVQNDNGSYTIVSDAVPSWDYIFLPSYAEVDHTDSTYDAEANRTYDWIINSRATVYPYNSSSTSFSTTGSNSETKNYMNIRFPYKAIGLTNRIFSNYSGSATVYSMIPNITRGDIFILSGHNVPFIYVDETDIQNGAPVVPDQGIFVCSRGGWVRGEYWWLRSVFKGPVTQPTFGLFTFVRPVGTISNLSGDKPSGLSNYNTASSELIASSAQGACICYSFGV